MSLICDFLCIIINSFVELENYPVFPHSRQCYGLKWVRQSYKEDLFSTFFKVTLYSYWPRGFGNGPGDLGSISGCVIPKTLKMFLDTSLLYYQQYKVRITGKVEQSWERSSLFLMVFLIFHAIFSCFWRFLTFVSSLISHQSFTFSFVF